MTVLLDTTWLVEYLRGNEEIIRRVQEMHADGLAVSIISVAELYEGVYRSNQPEQNGKALKDLLSAFYVLDITEEIAVTYGRTRAALLRKGSPTGALDVLIAATALVHGLALATLDQDFRRIDNLSFVDIRDG